MVYFIAYLIANVAAVNGKIYFEENFNDASWEQRWVVPSDWKSKSELGAWKWTAGEFHGDAADKGIQTSEDVRFYGLSARLDAPFTNKDKELVIQMSVKHEQALNCAGAYIKLTGDMDQSKFGGDSPYQVMFGPDICSPNTKTHVTFHYLPKNENLSIKDQVRVESDNLSHLYMLVVKPDNTFEVLIDMQPAKSGTLEQNWDFMLPKEIKDPTAQKPKDWDDEGDGEWVHPMIPNPDCAEDSELYVRCKDCTHIGFELWQGRAGTLFDDVIVTDSFEEAKAYAAETFEKKRGPEKEAYEAARPRIRAGAVLSTGSIFIPVTQAPHTAAATQGPAMMDPPTLHKLQQLKNTVSKRDVLNINVANPLNNQSIGWSPFIDGGAEQSAMDFRTASLLGLKSGYDCWVDSHWGWMSVIELPVLGIPVEMSVCVSTIGYNRFGKSLMEELGLCHHPGRGITQCNSSVVVFAVV